MNLKFKNIHTKITYSTNVSDLYLIVQERKMDHFRLSPVIRFICDPIVHFIFRDYSIIIIIIKLFFGSAICRSIVSGMQIQSFCAVSLQT